MLEKNFASGWILEYACTWSKWDLDEIWGLELILKWVKTFGTDGTDEKDMNFEGPDGRMLGVELYALQIYKLKS